MPVVKSANLALRFLLELCALAALAYWGYRSGREPIAKIGLAIGAPLVAAVVWGAVVAPQAPLPVPPLARLAIEVAIFGLAATALARAGQPNLAVILAVAYVVNRALVAVLRQ